MASAAWALALVIAAGWFVSIEWTSPYCQHQSDGPGYAAYGIPLPFVQYGGWSSLHYQYMPHVFVLNVLLLSLLAYPFVRWPLRRISSSANAGRIVGIAGLVVCGLVIAVQLSFALTFFHPVSAISGPWESYWSFRPVGLTGQVLRYDCTQSSYWFGEAE
jgi:hypothetical protein